jgi:hypothetical protein
MEKVEHYIDNHKNALYLDWDETMKYWCHKLQGLEYGSTAQTHISMVSVSMEKPPATVMLANVSMPNDVPNDAPIEHDEPKVPKNRKWMRKRGGARHRKRVTSLRVVEATLAVIDWDNEVDEVAHVGDGELQDMDTDIRKEFANLFKEPTCLAPR